MSYDPVAESIRLLASGPPDVIAPISRRRRFTPVSRDVDGAVATTLFLRRRPGELWSEAHFFQRQDESWQWIGGGGGSDGDRYLTARPDFDSEGRWAEAVGGGGSALDYPSGPVGWVGSAEIRCAVGVDFIVLPQREIRVPGHGWALVLWHGRTPPVAETGRPGA